jgi:hypothetical protein
MHQEAQKSEAHHATEDATTSPANRSPGAAKPRVRTRHANARDDHPRTADHTTERSVFPDGARVRRDEFDFGSPIDLDVVDK